MLRLMFDVVLVKTTRWTTAEDVRSKNDLCGQVKNVYIILGRVFEIECLLALNTFMLQRMQISPFLGPMSP